MDLSNFIILYVDNVQRSVDFYRPLFEREAVQATDDFAMFVSETGAKFGLWQKAEVVPKVDNVTAGSSEISFMLENLVSLQIQHTKSRELGVHIIQDLTEMDFGTTFTAIDPDGHRLRFYTNEKLTNEKANNAP